MNPAPAADAVPALRAVTARRRQLRWLIGTLGLVALVLAGWYVVDQRRAAEREALERTTLYARVLEDQVSRALTTTAGTLRALSTRGTLRRAIDEPADAQRLLEQQLPGQSHLRSLSLVDDAGFVLVATSAGDAGRRVDLDALGRSADDAQRIRLGPPLAIRDLADLEGPAAPPGVTALPLVTRVPMEQGQAPLWLVAIVNPDHFVNQHTVLAGDSGVRALLADLGGRIVVATDDVPLAPGATVSMAPLARFLPRLEHGAYVDDGGDGEPVVAAFRVSRQWPLLVLTEQPLDIVRAAWRERAVAVAAMGTLGLGGLVLLGLAADRSLRREAQALAERESLHREVARAEERFRAAFDHAAVGIAQLDRERRVLRVNPAICRMLGVQPQDFVHVPLWALLHPDDAEDGARDVARLLAGEIPSFTAERRYRHRDGHYVWGRITGSVTHAPDGAPEFLVLVVEDVSARRQAEADLERAREREMAFGARIQRSLLAPPVAVEQPGLWLSSFNQASQGIDGDFVEVVALGDAGVDIVLGDVMGKGVAAALMGAATKMQLSRSIAELTLRSGRAAPPEPAQVVTAAHRAMNRSLQALEAFVTLSYVRLDTRRGRVTWVGCGHEEPLLLRADGTSRTLANQHPPLGVLDDVDYTQEDTAFDLGDAVFLASDGAADALLPDGSRFGRERIAAVLRRLCDHARPPAAMLHALRAELARSGARMDDDVTLAMAVRVDARRSGARREFATGLGAIADVRELVEQQARRAGLDETPADLFTIACVEAYTNAVRHTRGALSEAPVEVIARVEPQALVVEIVNVGDRFEPPAQRTPTGFDDYPEGGFGLDIMERAADRVEYLHRDGINTVRLTYWREPGSH